jgi:hypothetical protein
VAVEVAEAEAAIGVATAVEIAATVGIAGRPSFSLAHL